MTYISITKISEKHNASHVYNPGSIDCTWIAWKETELIYEELKRERRKTADAETFIPCPSPNTKRDQLAKNETKPQCSCYQIINGKIES